MTFPAGISLLVHAVVLIAILWQPLLRVPVAPMNQATLQVLLTRGNGEQRVNASPAPTPPLPPTHKAPTPVQPMQETSAPSPRLMPPRPATKTPALPPPAAKATPSQQNLPMEFGELSGPSVQLDQNRDKSVEATTRPDQGNLAPTYPPEAVRLHETGTVALVLHVAADGFVDRVEVLQSSGYPLLDRAAVARLRTWHFLPATRGGVPVPSIYKIAVTFRP